jgi:quercetin dioxygenase-like cupin family protein/hemerythrin-like domain-containing protein
MKRNRALVALSHDHHHALVAARRLREAAAADADPVEAAAQFSRFFRNESTPHFRDEEENVFPLVAEREEAQPLLIRALLEHQRLYALVARLEDEADLRGAMTAVAGLLEGHVRFEERELFPLIERLAGVELENAAPPARGGPVWGEASEDLNATLLAWGAGEGPSEHVNAERDVLVFVYDGSVDVTIGDEQRVLREGEAVIIPKGERRRLTAGRAGVRYLSVHLRRPPLQIAPRPRSEPR